jgi:hypothetical protein
MKYIEWNQLSRHSFELLVAGDRYFKMEVVHYAYLPVSDLFLLSECVEECKIIQTKC